MCVGGKERGEVFEPDEPQKKTNVLKGVTNHGHISMRKDKTLSEGWLEGQRRCDCDCHDSLSVRLKSLATPQFADCPFMQPQSITSDVPAYSRLWD